jgi:hypothetical protein
LGDTRVNSDELFFVILSVSGLMIQQTGVYQLLHIVNLALWINPCYSISLSIGDIFNDIQKTQQQREKYKKRAIRRASK